MSAPTATSTSRAPKCSRGLVGTLRGAGVDLALAEARASVLKRAQAAGVLDTLGEDHVFRTLDEAVHALSAARAIPTK